MALARLQLGGLEGKKKRISSWIEGLMAQILGDDGHFEGDMGAREAPYGPRVALARPRLGGLEGTFPAVLQCLHAFHASCALAHGLGAWWCP